MARAKRNIQVGVWAPVVEKIDVDGACLSPMAVSLTLSGKEQPTRLRLTLTVVQVMEFRNKLNKALDKSLRHFLSETAKERLRGLDNEPLDSSFRRYLSKMLKEDIAVLDEDSKAAPKPLQTGQRLQNCCKLRPAPASDSAQCKRVLPHAPLHVIDEVAFQHVQRAKVLLELGQSLGRTVLHQRLLPRKQFEISDVLL
jgi:hypothetical protein